MNTPVSPYVTQLQKRLNAISPGSYESLSTISCLPLSQGTSILSTLLQFACQSQHTGMIVLARQAIAEIPSEWLLQQLPQNILEVVSLEDEWEFRRLLELLQKVAPQLLNTYIGYGLKANNDEVKDAANDFLPLKAMI